MSSSYWINVMKAQSQKSQIFTKVKGTSIKSYKASQKISNANIFLFRNSTFSKKATKTFRYLFSQTSGGRRDQSYPQWYPRWYSVRTVKVLCTYCGTTIGTIGLPACIQDNSVLLSICGMYRISGNIFQYLVVVPM